MSATTLAILAAMVGGYVGLVSFVATYQRNKNRRHARTLSAPRLYGRRFTPRHAQIKPAAREHAEPAEMGLAA